jgi:hypothetical protein
VVKGGERYYIMKNPKMYTTFGFFLTCIASTKQKNKNEKKTKRITQGLDLNNSKKTKFDFIEQCKSPPFSRVFGKTDLKNIKGCYAESFFFFSGWQMKGSLFWRKRGQNH